MHKLILIIALAFSYSLFAIELENKVIDLNKHEVVDIRILGCGNTEFPKIRSLGDDQIKAHCYPIICTIHGVHKNSMKRALVLNKSSINDEITCYENRDEAIAAAKKLSRYRV